MVLSKNNQPLVNRANFFSQSCRLFRKESVDSAIFENDGIDDHKSCLCPDSSILCKKLLNEYFFQKIENLFCKVSL